MDMEDDLYKVLGFENGSQVSQHDVRKAYRTRALVWHPDKQAGKNSADVSAAAAEYDKIRRALEVLGDENARKAYDELWKLRRIRLEKEKQFSSKRQKMMQDLLTRERAFESERTEKREEELAAKRLQAEIARIRAFHAKKQSNWASVEFAFDSQSSGQFQNGNSQPLAAPTPAQVEEMQNTLKASWTTTDGGEGGYTASRLRDIFAEFGGVEDVVIRQSKARKRGSALVVMSSRDAAVAATKRQCGDLSNPLLVVPALPLTSTPQVPGFRPQEVPEDVTGSNHVIGSRYKTYENDVLTKMRQAAERARLIKEMKEADAKTT